jgi:hypothetical protein
MKLGISQDARPQAAVLLTAAVLSIILWFIPFAEILTYPFRIFVTFHTRRRTRHRRPSDRKLRRQS